MRIEFTIPGAPRGKGRPRFARTGKYVRTYTPKDTASYENLITLEFERQCPGAFLEKEVPIRMEVLAYYQIPKSASKSKKESMLRGKMRPTKKPDSSNVVKAIEDALNGIAYHDDAQIVETIIRRWYGEVPRVEVSLEPVTTE